MNIDLPFLSLGFLLAASSAMLLGISKAGIKGIAALIVTGLALVYGAKNSTGITMPLLICVFIVMPVLLEARAPSSADPRDNHQVHQGRQGWAKELAGTCLVFVLAPGT